jgi:hypothetical protein
MQDFNKRQCTLDVKRSTVHPHTLTADNFDRYLLHNVVPPLLHWRTWLKVAFKARRTGGQHGLSFT